MKKALHTLLALLVALSAFSQTNTFPTTGNVGIGTTSPSDKVHVVGNIRLANGYDIISNDNFAINDGGLDRFNFSSGNYYRAKTIHVFYKESQEIMRLTENGNVGIGTTSPSQLLHMKSTFPYVRLEMDTDNKYSLIEWLEPSKRLAAFGWKGNVSNKRLTFYTDNGIDFDERLVIQADGNVGIGTTSPIEKLEVNGTIRTRKVKVEATGWPDYVFANDYKLMGIGELERYIRQNKHLPEVPSAQEVDEKGLDLGSMDATLLKKVEELTLYLIEQNKRLDTLEKENKELKKEIKTLKK